MPSPNGIGNLLSSHDVLPDVREESGGVVSASMISIHESVVEDACSSIKTGIEYVERALKIHNEIHGSQRWPTDVPVNAIGTQMDLNLHTMKRHLHSLESNSPPHPGILENAKRFDSAMDCVHGMRDMLADSGIILSDELNARIECGFKT